jgi:hypothetical protein
VIVEGIGMALKKRSKGWQAEIARQASPALRGQAGVGRLSIPPARLLAGNPLR